MCALEPSIKKTFHSVKTQTTWPFLLFLKPLYCASPVAKCQTPMELGQRWHTHKWTCITRAAKQMSSTTTAQRWSLLSADTVYLSCHVLCFPFFLSLLILIPKQLTGQAHLFVFSHAFTLSSLGLEEIHRRIFFLLPHFQVMLLKWSLKCPPCFGV